jgi:Asp-tRNA(Asn)/Glu-tRNA(Gln) amidotransferase A subunit family amidase
VTPEGPLHGSPFAVKEVIEVAGIPSACGCQVFKDRLPHEDATVVKRLRSAGAVLVGTQVSHELTCGLDEPPTRNPWNTDCYPGGSSAGAGVSVAVGSTCIALGTDAAGSVRIPAAMTGVVGMKPTAGLISRKGVVREASAPSIDNIGIIARKVADIGHVLVVISGPDPADERTLHEAPSDDYDPLKEEAGIESIQIAILGHRTQEALNKLWPLEKEIENAFRCACDEFRSAGAEIITIELPSLASATKAIMTFFASELAIAHRDLILDRAADYHPDVLVMLEQAVETSQSEVMEAVQLRATLREDIAEAFSVVGAQHLMTPTTPRVAMPLSTFQPANELGSLIPYTCGFNLTGQPAISVPCGFTSGSLPIGLQIIGMPYQDSSVLQLAQVFEQRTSWHEKRPTLGL